MELDNLMFDIRGRPELSLAIQRRLIELGCVWFGGGPRPCTISTISEFLNVDTLKSDTVMYFSNTLKRGRRLASLQHLYDMKPPEIMYQVRMFQEGLPAASGAYSAQVSKSTYQKILDAIRKGELS